MVDLSRMPQGIPWNLFHDGDGYQAEVWSCHQAWLQDEEPIECWGTTPQEALDAALDELQAHGVDPVTFRPALPPVPFIEPGDVA